MEQNKVLSKLVVKIFDLRARGLVLAFENFREVCCAAVVLRPIITML
jgi:hypothetical protein